MCFVVTCWKGLTSWLSFVVSSVSLSLSHWYPGSGVVLDCIDSWSLHHYLLLVSNKAFAAWWFLPCGVSHRRHFKYLNVPLNKLLSHTATKDELTVVLSKELLEFSKENKFYTVAWYNKAEASHRGGMYTISAEVKKQLDTPCRWCKSKWCNRMGIFFTGHRYICSLPKKIPRIPRETIFVTGGKKFNLGQSI